MRRRRRARDQPPLDSRAHVPLARGQIPAANPKPGRKACRPSMNGLWRRFKLRVRRRSLGTHLITDPPEGQSDAQTWTIVVKGKAGFVETGDRSDETEP